MLKQKIKYIRLKEISFITLLTADHINHVKEEAQVTWFNTTFSSFLYLKYLKTIYNKNKNGLKKMLLSYIYNIFLYRMLWAVIPTFKEYELYPQYWRLLPKFSSKKYTSKLCLKTYLKTILHQEYTPQYNLYNFIRYFYKKSSNLYIQNKMKFPAINIVFRFKIS